MIQKLHEAGADLFRINMSHASHELMRTLIKRIRSVEAALRPADRHSRRPSGPEAARRQVRGRAR
jgi:hypothetical protein